MVKSFEVNTTILTKPTTNVTSTILDKKIREAAAGLAPSWTKSLLSVPLETAEIIADYILVMKSEVNLSDSYRRDVIEVLTKLILIQCTMRT